MSLKDVLQGHLEVILYTVGNTDDSFKIIWIWCYPKICFHGGYTMWKLSGNGFFTHQFISFCTRL